MQKRLMLITVLGALVLALPLTGTASTLSIFMTGLDLSYDGYTISSVDAGSGKYPGADNLITAQFILNGSTLVGTSTATYADVVISGITGLSSAGSATSSSGVGHGFDLFFDDLGGFLDLDWDSPVDISLNNILGELSVHGSAVTSDISQALPFGLALGTPVEVTFSQQITSFETGPGPLGVKGINAISPQLADDPYITSFRSFGSGEISAPSAVPEPGTLFLLGAGLMGGIARARRRRRA